MNTSDHPTPAYVLPHDATGTWCLTSQSGTRHVLRLPPDAPSLATRRPASGSADLMRGDNEDLPLLAWYAQRDDDGAAPDLTIGDCLVMVLRPLQQDAQLTVRLTSPIVAIEQLTPDEQALP